MATAQNASYQQRFLTRHARKPLLSAHQERRLLHQYHHGNETEKNAALDTLIERNLRLVLFFARSYQSRCQQLEFDDIVSAGVIGLIVAISRFSFKKGNKLSTYAS